MSNSDPYVPDAQPTYSGQSQVHSPSEGYRPTDMFGAIPKGN